MFNKKTNINEMKFTNPTWIDDMFLKFQSAMSNVFLLTGNISDYPIPGELFDSFILRKLVKYNTQKFKGFDSVFFFDIHEKGREVFNSSNTEENAKKIGITWDAMLSVMSQSNRSNCLIIKFPEFLFPEESHNSNEKDNINIISFIKLINSEVFQESNHMIILVSETKSGINGRLLSSSSKLTPISILYPNYDERLEYIDYLEKTSSRPVAKEITNAQFAQLTAGLSRINIEDINLIAESKGVLKVDMILSRKNELIYKEYGEVIEVYDTMGMSFDDYAGQDHIKSNLDFDMIEPIRNGDIKAVPKGILFTGAPGTGKTYLSQCLAGSSGINFLQFRISKILNKYVGESEQNLEKAFNCFKSMAPVGVFIDEVDQALGRGDSHSNNVASNMFGMFLSFMSDEANRGKIVFIGATNYPNKIDEALKRTGRFDIKIPFFPPNKEERVEVMKVHFKKRGINHISTESNISESIQKDVYAQAHILSDEDFLKLSDMTDKYTQAEIENVVIKAIKVAKRRKLEIINLEVVEYAMSQLVHASSSSIDEMTELALNEVNDYEYLNEFYGKVKRLMVEENMKYSDAYKKCLNA